MLYWVAWVPWFLHCSSSFLSCLQCGVPQRRSESNAGPVRCSALTQQFLREGSLLADGAMFRIALMLFADPGQLCLTVLCEPQDKHDRMGQSKATLRALMLHDM
mmetsp:Transcript_42189/g.75547  ORF Transcript_42189/g.75547 Transcript_42189/m.75547 type:complete len:104 (+) Transcript_42189:596-907(+)